MFTLDNTHYFKQYPALILTTHCKVSYRQTD